MILWMPQSSVIWTILTGVAVAQAQTPEAPPHEIDPFLARQISSTMRFLLLSTLLLLVFFVGAYLILRFGRIIRKRTEKPATPTSYIDAWTHYRISQEEIDRLTNGSAPEDGRSDGDKKPD